MEKVHCGNTLRDDDLYDAVVSEEEKNIKSGYNEGFLAGNRHGLTEGKSLGKKKGFETAQELGYYYGFCQTFIAIYENTHEKTKNQQKAYAIFRDIVSRIQSLNTCDPLIVGKLLKIRSLFRQVSALLNLKNIDHDTVSSGTESLVSF